MPFKYRPIVSAVCALSVALGIVVAAVAYSQDGVSSKGDDVGALRRQISALTDRVAELEKLKFGYLPKDNAESKAPASAAPPGTVVQAPFTIVNRAGKPIVVVYEDGGTQGLSVRNPAGNPIASLWAQSDGYGSVTIFDGLEATGAPTNFSSMRFRAQKAEMVVAGDDGARASVTSETLALFEKGKESARLKNYGELGGQVRIFNGAGFAIAGMQTDAVATNSGTVLVGSPQGTKGQLYVSDGVGAMILVDAAGKILERAKAGDGYTTFNLAGQAVAQIGSVPSGNNGRLWLGNASGEGIVEAGMLTDGLGTVRAGPSFGARPSALAIPDRIVGHR